jgi:hypothetical protein
MHGVSRPHAEEPRGSAASRSMRARCRNSRIPGAAQHEAQRNDALQTRDRWGLRRSRISDAPLRLALALHRIRDT